MDRLRDFDTRYGTDTGGEIPVELLDYAAEIGLQAVSYEATDAAAFRHMVGELPIRHGEYTFLDLGSGKGRVVFLAAEVPFAHVIGVEASGTLHTIACQNLRAWSRAGHDGRRIKLRNEGAPWLARMAWGRGFQQGDYGIWRSHGDHAGG